MMIKNMFYLIAIACSIMFISCEKDDDITIDPGENAGKLAIEITDAPIDQPNVTATYVTIADLQIDGHSITGFQKVSINLLDLQNGVTKALGNITLPEKSYNKITLVLDHETDAEGNAPGSYILINDTDKHALRSTMTNLEAEYAIDIKKDSTTTLVLDFDLRKSIDFVMDTSASEQFKWTSAANFNNALRIVDKDEASTIKGMVNSSSSTVDEIVAYVYAKGTYDQNIETDTTSNDIRFSHAISSSLVQENNEYEVHFLDPGDYEVHFAGYQWNEENSMLEYSGLLEISSSIDITDIKLEASTETTIDLSIVGILGL